MKVGPGNIIVGIQGIEAAKAYPLGPNTRAYMFDMEKDFLYIKETDLSGMQKGTLKILKCTEVKEEELNNTNQNNTLTFCIFYEKISR